MTSKTLLTGCQVGPPDICTPMKLKGSDLMCSHTIVLSISLSVGFLDSLHDPSPASIATLAQRWPNVNPYVGPTSAHQRWANVDLSIGPTLAQRLHANVGPTLCQHRPNVGTLTLGQRWHNVMPMVVCQHWPNGGCVTGFLWGEPIGHRLNKQSSWVTSDLRHQCDRRQCNIHMSKNVTVLFRRCTDWSKHNVQKDNGLLLTGAKPLIWTNAGIYCQLDSCKQTSVKFNRNHIFAFKKMHLKMSSGKWRSFCLGLNELIWIKFSC